MPKKYVYRKQMSGLLDYHGFRTQTEDFLNSLDGDISAANAKIGNLSSLTTTDKSNLVAAINEAAQSEGGGGSEWEWDPTPANTITLEDPWYDDTEDGPYGYSIPLTGQHQAVFVDIQYQLNVSVSTGSVRADAIISGMASQYNMSVLVPNAISTVTENACAVRFIFMPVHGLYRGYGNTKPTWNSGPLATSYQESYVIGGGDHGFFEPLFVTTGSYFSEIRIFPSSNMLIAGTTINVYHPKV